MTKTWLEFYELAKDYFEEFGHLDIKTEEIYKGKELGNWASIQRYRRKIPKSNRSWSKISEEEINLLNEINFNWDRNRNFDKIWMKYYNLAKKYFNEYGDLNISNTFVYEGVNLGNWIRRQRDDYKNNRISENRIILLNNINFCWDMIEAEWISKYKECEVYYHKFGHSNIPKRYIQNNLNIGAWVIRQRRLYQTGKLSLWQIKLLDKLEFCWEYKNNYKQTSFGEYFFLFYLRRYFSDIIHRYKIDNLEFDIYIPSINLAIEYDGVRWHKDKKENDLNKNKFCLKNNINLIRIRENGLNKINKDDFILNKKVNLEDALIYLFYKLNILDYEIDLKKDSLLIYDMMEIDNSWMNMYKEAEKYFRIHKTMIIPQDSKEFKTLRNWRYTQRRLYKNNQLSSKKIDLLNKINAL